jgi:formamidopyrimidine-DNA glycosylase
LSRLGVELHKNHHNMPELPDLQAFSHNLEKRIANKKVVDIQLNSKKSNVTPEVLKTALKNKHITSVYREGKELRITFSNNKLLGLHLMLHGELHIVPEKEEVKFSVFEMVLDDGQKFVLSDFQKQARPTLDPEENSVPDALSASVDYAFWKALLASKKAAIKNVLLDQSLIRGIGNAYADEILWDAKIAPLSISNEIPDAAIKALAKSVRKVLESAISQILKAEPEIISGEIRTFLKIHKSKNLKSPNGHTISVEKHGARKTYFTDEQVLYGK